jgi:sugar phosphate permease
MAIVTGSALNEATMINCWPKRHVVVGLSFLGCVVAYTDRVNISVAAVAMKEHFGWSQTEKGMVLSAYLALGYTEYQVLRPLGRQRVCCVVPCFVD